MNYNLNKISSLKLIMLALVAFVLSYNPTSGARIKNIAAIEGVSGVQVIGYGLVVGLNQTGDNQLTSYTNQSVLNMLKRFGLTTPNKNIRMRNVAAVMITATIPQFLKAGSKVDVLVSSLGDATSLQGGVLLMTPMSTSKGTILGNAQGAVSVGGYDYRSLGSRIGRNFVTSGRVPNGLILDSAVDAKFVTNQLLRIVLRDPDFTTSTRVAAAINGSPNLANSATPIDAGAIEVKFPDGSEQMQIMQYIAQIEALNVIADPVARVVINERTGTIVVGGNVELLPAVIAHGGLDIFIQRQVVVAQPAPFTIFPPRPVESAIIETQEELNPATPLEFTGASVADIADALNLLQVKPRDLIAIFQALKEAGSLQGELIIQ